jgi:hypothetical protein
MSPQEQWTPHFMFLKVSSPPPPHLLVPKSIISLLNYLYVIFTSVWCSHPVLPQRNHNGEFTVPFSFTNIFHYEYQYVIHKLISYIWLHLFGSWSGSLIHNNYQFPFYRNNVSKWLNMAITYLSFDWLKLNNTCGMVNSDNRNVTLW